VQILLWVTAPLYRCTPSSEAEESRCTGFIAPSMCRAF
jgi:hypothetical protein